jgi:hypothetical protein
MSDQPIRLNLGAGDKPLDGYVNIDRKTGGEVYPLTAKYGPESLEIAGDKVAPKPGVTPVEGYADGSVEEVRASHVLEHFSHRDTFEVLKEWVRVLRPGGCIKVAVPDFDYIVSAYNDERAGQLPLEGYLFGGHVDGDDRHGAMFNEQKLRALMRAAGLTNIRRWTSDAGDCASLPVSLNLMGYKRTGHELKGVSAVLSAPRLCFTDTMVGLCEMIYRLRVPLRIRQGVFFGQTMTMAIEEAIAAGAEYVLTVDYDSLFDADDVTELHRLLVEHPEADAVVAAQVGRSRDTLLMTIRGEDGRNRDRLTRAEADAELLKVSTAHFGLTLFRASAIQKMAKPWFLHHPDPDGRWGDARVDEDIHWWRQWEACGNTAYQANHVRIGHMQMMATWPTPDFEPVHQHVSDWRTNGKPEGVR